MSPSLRNNYRFWDIDEWREQMKRDRAKKSERRALMTVSALGIIVFICVSYFGTLLFLRITKLP
jgi:amino acid permease